MRLEDFLLCGIFNCLKVSDILNKRTNKFPDKFCTSDNLLCKIVTVWRCSCLYVFVVAFCLSFNLTTSFTVVKKDYR